MRFILVVGYPGTGKTTLSCTLGQILQVPVVSKDTIRDTCALCSFDYESVGDLAYELLIAVARDQLKLGLSVILDSASTKVHRRQQARALAKELGAEFYMIECVCPDEGELRKRIAGRSVPEFRVGNWTKFKRVSRLYESFTESRLIVNTQKSIRNNITEVLSYLGVNTPAAYRDYASGDK